MKASRSLTKVPLALAVALISIAACGEGASDGAALPEPNFVAPSVWSSPTGISRMRLYLGLDGNARFEGGFEFFNPARWEYLESSGELRLHLAGVTREIESVLEEAPSRAARTGYDANARALLYEFDEAVDSLWVAGFYFRRDGR